MKLVKIVVGSLGVLFALTHLVRLVLKIVEKRTDFNSPYSTGTFFGSIGGIAIGIAIASLCFRKKKESGISK